MRYKILLILIMFTLVGPVYAAENNSNQTKISSLLQQIAALQEKIKAQAQTQSKTSTTNVTVNQTPVAGWKFERADHDLFEDSEIQEKLLTDDYDVKTYLVRNNRLYVNYSNARVVKDDSYKIWNIYADILGDEWVAENIRQYNTYRDPDGSLYGFVRHIEDKSPEWGFAVDISRADFENKTWVRDMIIVMLHETAHIATLNDKQVMRNVKYAKYCLDKSGFFTGTMCAKKDSYLKSYGKAFWSNKEFISSYNKLQQLDGAEYTEKKREYYNNHQVDFVTAYALKSPEEDIAESFVNFILDDKPTGKTLKEQKIKFFYKYPELVGRRLEIRDRIKEYFLEN
ncbi:MAG: hypothetical protein RLZZ230_508 [Candidatus Parcubacteria bacterium]|jgi:hypothetical protein